MPRFPLAALALFAASAAGAFADSRAEFLKLIDRPRVPLAATVGESMIREGHVEIAFSFAADVQNRVPGILIKAAATPAGAPGRRPVVVALHGTGGNKESQRKLLNELARDGFVAVAIDGRHHGARAKGGSAAKSTEYVAAILEAYRHPGKAYPFFYDTAWDVMRLIDYLETRDDVDAKRVGAIGFSKGGIETYLAAAADPRIAVAVPVIGVQSFRWAIENNAWRSRIETVQMAFDTAAREADVAAPNAEFVRAFYDRVAPGIYGRFDGPAMVPLIAPRPLLMINGDIDPRTPAPGLKECVLEARAVYHGHDAADKFHVHLQRNTAHKTLPESVVLAREWFVRWLKP